MRYILSFLFLFAISAGVSAQVSNTNGSNIKVAIGEEPSDVSELAFEKVNYFEGKVYIDDVQSSTRAVIELGKAKIESIHILKNSVAKTRFNSDYPILAVTTKQ